MFRAVEADRTDERTEREGGRESVRAREKEKEKKRKVIGFPTPQRKTLTGGRQAKDERRDAIGPHKQGR